MTTVTNGLRDGNFTTLNVLKDGSMQDVLDLIAAGGGGGGGGGGSGTVTSATAPLNIDNSGVLTIDLGSYVLTSALNSALANKVDTLTGGGAVVVSGSGTTRTITVDLASYATTAAVNTLLSNYTTTAALTTLLASKLDSLTGGGAVTITGSGTSRTITVDLASYATTAAVNTLLTSYTTTSALNTLLASYATTAAVNTLLNSYTTTSALNTLLANKISTLTGAGAVVISGSGTSRSINVDLSNYALTSTVNTALGQKQDTITASSPLALNAGQLSINLSPYALVSQVNAKADDFQLDSSFVVDTNVSPRAISLDTTALTTTLSASLVTKTSIFQNGTGPNLIIKDGNANSKVLQNDSGALKWDGNELAVQSDTVQSISVTAPLVASTSNRVVSLSTNWKPTNLSVSGGLIGIRSDSLGTFDLATTDNHEYLQVKIKDGNAVVRNLTATTGGSLQWNGASLATETFANNLFSSNVTVGGDLAVEGGDITLSNATATSNFGLPIMSLHSGATNYMSLGFTITGNGHNNDTQALRITRTGTITSTSAITTHSDASIKTDVEDLDAAEAQAMFDAIKPKRYKRTDIETDKFRVGFMAQDFESDFAPNLVGEEPSQGLKTLDYARLTCILWQVCKNMQARITALEAASRERRSQGTRKRT